MLVVFRGYFKYLAFDFDVRGELHDLLDRAFTDKDVLILVVSTITDMRLR